VITKSINSGKIELAKTVIKLINENNYLSILYNEENILEPDDLLLRLLPEKYKEKLYKK